MAREQQVQRRSFMKAAGAATAATMTMAGCITGESGEDGGGGTLTYARGSDSGTLDPQATTSGEDAKVIQQLYDQVIHFKGGETTLTDGLAKEFELDGTQVNLTFREGATFQSGEEFTAADFKATYRRFLDSEYENFVGSENQSYYGPYLLSSVEEVQTNGDYEVTLQLGKQHAPMLRNLAVFAFAMISKSAIEGEDPLRENPDGTGPFRFEEWNTSDAQIRLSKNEDYWGTKANVDEVVFSEIGENSSRASALNAGEVDIIDGLDAQTTGTVESAGDAELVTTPGINVGYMALNMARKEELRSKEVRQAINYAVDTKTIVENIYSGLAVQASQPVPENMAGYNDSVDPYSHDPDQAQTLLEEAGYGDGFEMEIATFQNPRTYNPSPVSAAEAVKSNLSEVGIDVTINQMEWNSYLEYTAAGKHDACFLGWMTDNADPDNFFYALLTPGAEIPDDKDWVEFGAEGFNSLNVAAWANEEYTTLVTEAQTTYDEQARVENYEKASKIAHDEAPWLFVDHAKELRGVHSRVSGFTIAPISGPFLNRVSLE